MFKKDTFLKYFETAESLLQSNDWKSIYEHCLTNSIPVPVYADSKNNLDLIRAVKRRALVRLVELSATDEDCARKTYSYIERGTDALKRIAAKVVCSMRGEGRLFPMMFRKERNRDTTFIVPCAAELAEGFPHFCEDARKIVLDYPFSAFLVLASGAPFSESDRSDLAEAAAKKRSLCIRKFTEYREGDVGDPLAFVAACADTYRKNGVRWKPGSAWSQWTGRMFEQLEHAVEAGMFDERKAAAELAVFASSMNLDEKTFEKREISSFVARVAALMSRFSEREEKPDDWTIIDCPI